MSYYVYKLTSFQPSTHRDAIGLSPTQFLFAKNTLDLFCMSEEETVKFFLLTLVFCRPMLISKTTRRTILACVGQQWCPDNQLHPGRDAPLHQLIKAIISLSLIILSQERLP